MVEILWELDFVLQRLLEQIHGVVAHEGWSAYHHFIEHDSSSVPVDCLRVAEVQNDFWCDIFWGTTEREGLLALGNRLQESKVSQLDEASRRDQNVLRLQVAVNHVLAMKILERKNNLSEVESGFGHVEALEFVDQLHEVSSWH